MLFKSRFAIPGALARLSALLAVVGALSLAAPSQAAAADLDDDYPRHGAYKDYWGDRESDERYSDRHDRRCAPRHVVRERLERDGWADFKNADPRGGIVVVEARRRHSGRPFQLRIDRCSGEVVRADPVGPPRYERARRWRDYGEARWRRWAGGQRRYYDAY